MKITPYKVDGEWVDTENLPTPSVDELLIQGVEQLSRKYRSLARLPPGMTGIQALQERSPEKYQQLLKDMELRAAHVYRHYVARNFGDDFELTPEEFNEYLAKTGRKPSKFNPEDKTPCPHCESLGHMHRKDCPNR